MLAYPPLQVKDPTSRSRRQVVYYPTGELVFLDTNQHFCITAAYEFVRDVEELLGEDTVFVKPDTSMPQPQRRQFNGSYAREKAAWNVGLTTGISEPAGS